VIIANHLWEEKLTLRSVSKQKCSVVLNHIDPTVFYRRAKTRSDQKFILLFPGTWQWHQGLDIAIEALGHLKHRIPNAELHLYGGGGGVGTQARLAKLAGSLGLDGRVKFFGDVPLEQIANVIANADIGVVPKRADSFGNEAYSTKIMEFMSQGVPVVASRTKIDSFYFDETLIKFFESGNSEAMADAIVEVKENHLLSESLIKRGLDYATMNSWDHNKSQYLNLVDTLSNETFGDEILMSAVDLGTQNSARGSDLRRK
jgi:glycosyltransferase involved in cell wall biosynthesis